MNVGTGRFYVTNLIVTHWVMFGLLLTGGIDAPHCPSNNFFSLIQVVIVLLAHLMLPFSQDFLQHNWSTGVAIQMITASE
jgi:hypothetical protein